MSAAQLFTMDSSFCEYKVYADIRGGTPLFIKKFPSDLSIVSLSPYVVLVICSK